MLNLLTSHYTCQYPYQKSCQNIYILYESLVSLENSVICFILNRSQMSALMDLSKEKLEIPAQTDEKKLQGYVEKMAELIAFSEESVRTLKL